MSNFYHHDTEEKKHKKYTGPRTSLPDLDPELWPDFFSYLEKRNLNPRLARMNGWFPTYSFDAYPRIVIPCSNSLDLPYFQARDISGNAKIRYHSPKASREDSVVIVHPPLSRSDPIKGTVVTEGPADALAAADFGWLGIALMGNDPPPVVVEYVARLVKGLYEPVLIVPDLDHQEMATLVSQFTMKGVMASCRLPIKKDLADMTLLERNQLLK